MSRTGQLGWTNAKVGILVIIALSIFVVMVMNLEQGMGLLARSTKFRAAVAHTQGLKVGGPVRMNGVDIGNVHQIAIPQGSPNETPHVEITFTIKNRVVSHIKEDATVMIRPMGLLGDKFVEVLPGTPSKPPLAPGSLIAGKAEADFTKLADDATVTIENVNTAILEMQRILTTINQGQGTANKLLNDSALYDQSKKVMDNLETASEKGVKLLNKVERGEGTIGKLMTDKDLYNRANQAVKELTALGEKLNDQNGTLVKLTDPTLYKRLESLTSRGEQLLRKVESGEGTMGKLVTQDELYKRADKLLLEVEEFVAE
ncbi:MAG TPA: MlaD family protein, partial [Nitrospiraceae bacterium]|nr:MlaD family protein [Nitrospiraceae bacterium]